MRTILLVEDDEQLKRLFVRLLERNGYQVFSAATVEEAVQVIDQRHSAIHLVVVDLLLGGESGLIPAKLFNRYNPDAKILVMSGHQDLLNQELEFPVLEKPFSPIQLLARVNEILDES